MSDYTQTMKDWRRMCKFYSATFETCCNGCPLDDIVEGNCGAIYDEEFADVVDWEEVEKRIDAWAAEHPEPKYPTWGEWFLSTCQVPVTPEGNNDFWKTLNSHIPADIAEKLGIEPKEG